MSSQSLKRLRWLLLGSMVAGAAQAVVYPLPLPDVDAIGEVKVVYARKEDTLLDIARAHSLGYDEIVHANPGVDRWVPGEGTAVVLPTRYILPDTPREGLVLNVAELRLYYYPPASAGGERVVHTYPVSIGRMDWKTPLGLTKVVAKEVDPAWRPPASIKAEHAREGDILPDVVPGGPDNPLGRHAMRLGVPGYLIHSTNKPFGIGMRVTHGCVRMYPEDIEGLFGMVPVGTSVRLIDQPVKVGRVGGELLLEVHEPLEEDNIPIKISLEQAEKAVVAKLGPDMPGVDQTALRAAMEQISGMPVSIAAEPGSSSLAGSAVSPSAPPGAYPPAERAPAPPPPAPAGQYRPGPSMASASPDPAYPAPAPAPERMPDRYSAPYDAAAAPSPVFRPAPPAPYRPAPYGSSARDRDEEPLYRPTPAPGAPPVDTPAYRSASAEPPRYARNPGAADYYDDEPPSLYPPTASAPAAPVVDSPSVRPVPSGSPVPYPRPSTPTVRPPTAAASADRL